jgi:hypothetical protein
MEPKAQPSPLNEIATAPYSQEVPSARAKTAGELCINPYTPLAELRAINVASAPLIIIGAHSALAEQPTWQG